MFVGKYGSPSRAGENTPALHGQGRGPGVKFFDNGRKALPNVEVRRQKGGDCYMAIAQCLKCGNPTYFSEETSVGGKSYPVEIIRCASCCTAIGVTMPDWAFEVLELLGNKINQM